MSVKEMSVFSTGDANEAFAQYFIGQSYLNMLSIEQVTIGNVTFEPRCRNNWHIPAEVKHWHGAAADSWFTHLAFEVSGENSSNEWLEPVTDEEYDKLK